MTCEEARDLIDRYLDDTLAPADRARLEEHEATCAECARDLAAARVARTAAGELSRTIPPPADLWPAIRSRLGVRRAPRRLRPMALAAAAIVLMSISSAATLWLTRAPARVTAGAESPQVIEAGWINATAELTRALDAERGKLSPATIATVERNLGVIDAAIAESRAALAHDPANRDLAALLWASYRQKVALLRQAGRLASET